MKSFSLFLNEGAYEVKQAAIKSGKGYTNDAAGRKLFDADYKQYGNHNNLSSAWKSFQVTGEIFDPKLLKSAPAKAAPVETFPVKPAEFKKLVDATKKMLVEWEAVNKLAGEMVAKMKPFYAGKKLAMKDDYPLIAMASIKDLQSDSDFKARINKRIEIAEHALDYAKKF